MYRTAAYFGTMSTAVPLPALPDVVVASAPPENPVVDPNILAEAYRNVPSPSSVGPESVRLIFTACVCAGKFPLLNVAVSAPPVLAMAFVPLAPTGKRSRMSGRLKVVDPSPTPNAVPITANSPA
jgi:hypothetical protein